MEVEVVICRMAELVPFLLCEDVEVLRVLVLIIDKFSFTDLFPSSHWSESTLASDTIRLDAQGL
jgi:hypothetical protein